MCIPRNVVYFNYVDFCSKNNMQPVNAASFGKVHSQGLLYYYRVVHHGLPLVDKNF